MKVFYSLVIAVFASLGSDSAIAQTEQSAPAPAQANQIDDYQLLKSIQSQIQSGRFKLTGFSEYEATVFLKYIAKAHAPSEIVMMNLENADPQAEIVFAKFEQIPEKEVVYVKIIRAKSDCLANLTKLKHLFICGMMEGRGSSFTFPVIIARTLDDKLKIQLVDGVGFSG